MHRTDVLCPECFKGKLLKDDSTKDTGSGYCDQCGEIFVFTGKTSVRYAKPTDTKDEPKAMAEEEKPKQKFHITIMSEDPDLRGSQDSHQKYGFSVKASDKAEAEMIGRDHFIDEYGGLPIYWIKVSDGVPLNHMS